MGAAVTLIGPREGAEVEEETQGGRWGMAVSVGVAAVVFGWWCTACLPHQRGFHP